jgi:2-polyprenyl-6-methoxyphenol hydroxylase-like FAD-dependent oxidoreductase
MDRHDVLIVGAGPSGLVLAIALAKAGVRPRIIDRKPGTSAESRALGVQARTLEFYRQLGFADRIVDRGVQVEDIVVRQNGRIAARLDVKDFGAGTSPYPFILCYPQDDHEKVLEQQLNATGVQVEWGTELVDMTDADAGIIATVSRDNGPAEPCVAGYVCGADGARSAVRKHMKVEFAGSTADDTYFVADVVATGRAVQDASPANAFSFCLNSRDFMLVLPARSSGTHRLIGLLPESVAGRDGVTFDDIRATVEAATDTRVEVVNWFSTYRVHHRVADRFRVGRAFLLGDAGHIHSPLGGQGMNTGIADAVNLAWKLAAVVQGRADTALLDTYEPERIAFARSLVATTDRMFGLVNGLGLRNRLVRRILFRGVIPALLGRAATRRAVFRKISQSLVTYRDGELSRGRAGRVRGGDRLPWIPLRDGHDNFEPLRSLDWQVHVYGAASDGLRREADRAALALHQFDWTAQMAEAGLARDALYLVRPDGYIAVADTDHHALPAYLRAVRVQPRTASHDLGTEQVA